MRFRPCTHLSGLALPQIHAVAAVNGPAFVESISVTAAYGRLLTVVCDGPDGRKRENTAVLSELSPTIRGDIGEEKLCCFAVEGIFLEEKNHPTYAWDNATISAEPLLNKLEQLKRESWQFLHILG